MKKKFKILIAVILFALNTNIALSQQTIDLSNMTDDVTIGQNCSSSQEPEEWVTTGDINLNGNELRLKNVRLTVTGNINAGNGDDGEIETCGQSTFCNQGSFNGDVEYDEEDVNCETLDLDDVDTLDLDYSFDGKVLKVYTVEQIRVFNMLGQEVVITKNNTIDFNYFDSGTYIVIGEKEGKSGVFKISF